MSSAAWAGLGLAACWAGLLGYWATGPLGLAYLLKTRYLG